MQTRVLLIENRNAATLRTSGFAIPVLGVVGCGWDEPGKADHLRHKLALLRPALHQAADQRHGHRITRSGLLR